MNTFTRNVSGDEAARRAVAALVGASVYFACEPQPEGVYALSVKAEESAALDRACGGVSLRTLPAANDDEGPRYESLKEPGVYYWAQRNRVRGSSVESWAVLAQAEGFPASEAHDDWFTSLKDADEVAQALARGEEQE